MRKGWKQGKEAQGEAAGRHATDPGPAAVTLIILVSSLPLFLIHKVLCPSIPIGGILLPPSSMHSLPGQKGMDLGFPPLLFKKNPEGKKLFTQSPLTDIHIWLKKLNVSFFYYIRNHTVIGQLELDEISEETVK